MKNCFIIYVMSLILLLCSCVTTKKVVYLEDMRPDTTYSAADSPPLKVQKSDRISIIVSAKTPELAAPFNQATTNYSISEQGNIATGNGNNAETGGYLINDRGEIDFPVLGTLTVAGMTINQIKDLIKQRLINDKLINEPIVRVELLNLKINMLGEVNSVGMLTVPDGNITLLEAISRAGGLTVNAASNRIIVIRQEDGKRRMMVNDIKSREIFNAPSYHLRQNDIVYIEPKDAVPTPKTLNNWRYIGTGIGLLATIFAILNFVK